MKILLGVIVGFCLIGMPGPGLARVSSESEDRSQQVHKPASKLMSKQVNDLEGSLFGYSYGGRVRSGPDMESSSVVSLREGERIRILENTGIWFEGYTWYRIRSRHGEGYHWGGIFCTESDEGLEGVFARCDGPSLADAIISGSGASQDAVVLRGDGVALADGQVLPFGLSKVYAIEQMTAVFGASPGQRERLDDCGPGALDTVSWDTGFVAYFQDDAFVGWSAIDERTAEGIGFGSTRAELDAAYGVSVEDTSLGAEFHFDGISGVLESQDLDAQINSLWAGMSCVMR